ncbi:unnamed protein product, partial [Mesorhabditis belari]|uniref:Uncharacterized protein n=1 Tax=Mesorhabditis belari TaxID=2138241 RepID=A0AAF3EBL5_9BILA
MTIKENGRVMLKMRIALERRAWLDRRGGEEAFSVAVTIPTMFGRFMLLVSTILLALFAFTTASPLIYRNPQFDDMREFRMAKRANAELINGLIGMDLSKLSQVGKRSNAELINGLLGMNLNKLSSAGRK